MKNSRYLATLTLAASLVSGAAFAQAVTGSSNDATANGGNGGRGGAGGSATVTNNFNITYIEVSNSGPVEINSSGPTQINSSGPTNIVSSGPTSIGDNGLGIGGLSFITTATGGAGGSGGAGGNGGSATAGGGLDPLDLSAVLANSVALANVGQDSGNGGSATAGDGSSDPLGLSVALANSVAPANVGQDSGAGGNVGGSGGAGTLAAVPEPATLALVGAGLFGAGLIRRVRHLPPLGRVAVPRSWQWRPSPAIPT